MPEKKIRISFQRKKINIFFHEILHLFGLERYEDYQMIVTICINVYVILATILKCNII